MSAPPHPPTTDNESPSTHPTDKPHDHHLILVFDYRTLLESDDLDSMNYNAWKEVLGGFGYDKLSFEHFLRTSMVHKSPGEVMASLCPYTTRAEWEPLLTKRTTRLLDEVKSLCYAEVLPLQGVKDLILDCAKKAFVTCVFLSPFPDEVTSKILDLAEMTSFMDIVHSYEDRDYSLPEALEMLNVRTESAQTSEGGAKTTTKRGESAKVPDIVVFSSDAQGCKQASLLGCRIVGISSNGGYVPPQASNDSNPHGCAVENNHDEHGRDTTNDRPPQDTLSHHEALLCSGAEYAVGDYTKLQYEYLFHIPTSSHE